MGKTNWKRVFLGGLVAGVVLPILELASMPLFMPQWVSVMQSLLEHPIPTEYSVGDIVFGVVFSVILGIVIIWLYAAIRPRLGAGPKTAVIAGLFVWFLSALNDIAYSLSVFHLFPLKAVLIRSFSIIVPFILAALAGAWVYKEQE